MRVRSDRWARAGTLLLGALLAAGVLMAALRGGSYGPIPQEETFVLVLWIATLGIALGVLPRRRLARGAALAVVALVALAVWTAVGLLWTESAERTMTEVARTLGLAGVLLLVVCTFGGRSWNAAALWLTGGAIAVVALALVSRLAPDLVSSPLTTAGLYRRLGYPFNYWNALGAWAAMTVALGLAVSAHASARWVRGGALGGVCLAIPVAYLTYSRTAGIAIALAMVGVVAVSRHRWQAVVNAAIATAGGSVTILVIRSHPEIANGRGTEGAEVVAEVCVLAVGLCVLAGLAGLTERVSAFRLPRRTATAALAAVAAVGLVGAVAVGPALADRLWTSFEQRSESTAVTDPAQRLGNLSGVRRDLWAVGLDTFRDHPLGGTGGGTYEFVWNRDARRDTAVRDAHSLYVETLAERGLPGLLLLATALVGLLVAGVRASLRERDDARAGLAGGCAVAFAVFCLTAGVDWMWELTAIAVLGLIAGGLACCAGGAETDAAVRLRPPVRAAGALAAFACLAVQLPVLMSASEVRESRQAISQGRVDDALSAAATAIAAQPWGASGYLQRALVLERAGALAYAAREARHATQRESTNWETWLILGRIEAERGRVRAALQAARRARDLNPSSPLFRRD
ncbi:MAG TPA: O-antigen ligase family protein [Baekduia sp.]|nr:O-antigen ligase family protein [Baekduia sp.]